MGKRSKDHGQEKFTSFLKVFVMGHNINWTQTDVVLLMKMNMRFYKKKKKSVCQIYI